MTVEGCIYYYVTFALLYSSPTYHPRSLDWPHRHFLPPHLRTSNHRRSRQRSILDMSVYSAYTGECTADGFSSPTGTSFETVIDSPQDLNDIIVSRWWETKALQTLSTTTNLYEIRLVCQHIPFADQDTPTAVLSQNWTRTHDTFLNILEAEHCPDSDQCIEADRLSRDRKAEKLVKLLMSDKRSSAPIQALFWCPPVPYSNKTPSSIAEEWISVFESMLAEVSWGDWMSMALGHDTIAICSLLERSRKTSICLRKYMNGRESSENKYFLVNQVSLVFSFDGDLV